MINLKWIKESGILERQQDPPFSHSLQAARELRVYYRTSQRIIDAMHREYDGSDNNGASLAFLEGVHMQRLEIMGRKAEELRRAIHADLLPASHTVYVTRNMGEVSADLESALANCVADLETIAVIAQIAEDDTFIHAILTDGTEAMEAFTPDLLEVLTLRDGDSMFREMFPG